MVKTRCTAKAKGTGKRCKLPPIKGATVCRKHGASAPQVKRKARERFNDLVDPAINRLAKVIDDDNVPAASQVAAAKDILDRAGYKPVEQIHDVTQESEESKELRKEFTLQQLKEIREELASRKS